MKFETARDQEGGSTSEKDATSTGTPWPCSDRASGIVIRGAEPTIRTGRFIVPCSIQPCSVYSSHRGCQQGFVHRSATAGNSDESRLSCQKTGPEFRWDERLPRMYRAEQICSRHRDSVTTAPLDSESPLPQ